MYSFEARRVIYEYRTSFTRLFQIALFSILCGLCNVCPSSSRQKQEQQQHLSKMRSVLKLSSPSCLLTQAYIMFELTEGTHFGLKRIGLFFRHGPTFWGEINMTLNNV